VGEQSFVAHAASFDVIHPKWYTMADDSVGVRPVGNTDLASVLAAAHQHGVRVWPLIDADNAQMLRTMIGDPQKRTQHVQNLVALVTQHGYAGLDIDYEHLWSKGDRPGFEAFMQELSAALHGAGAQLSTAIAASPSDDGASAYSYADLSQWCDALHVMGYDFHYMGGDHLGPLAPLGWIDQTFAQAAATGRASRFILGLANYGISSGWYTTANDAATRCGGKMLETTDHMATCPYGNFAAGRAPHCTTANGDVWFEDVASMEEKLTTALGHGAGGVTYWTLGDEPAGFFEMVARHLP
jgi:spore germination protein YaaH